MERQMVERWVSLWVACLDGLMAVPRVASKAHLSVGMTVDMKVEQRALWKAACSVGQWVDQKVAQ